VSNPPDINSHHFTEKLSLLSTSYLSNSYLDQTIDNLIRPAYPKEDLIRRLAWDIGGDQGCKGIPVDEDTILLGAFHGHSKITPMLFQVWTNILRSAGNSRLVMSPPSSSAALTNLIGELNYAGIMSQSSSRNSNSSSSRSSSSSRVLVLPHSEWFEHVYYKSAVDVYMDTIIKNGHTTTMDAAWGGIPILGLAGQSRATQRSTESISRYLLGDLDCCGLVYSLKEYEDVLIALIKTRRGRRRLEHWKRVARLMRLQSSFFNPMHFTDSFTRNLQALYEVHSMHNNNSSRVDTLYHVFHSSSTLN
jgi:predicted O-linked N-acetylglucosamine transferase (SPINDLY family)